MLENVTIRDVERELNELRDASTEPGQPPRLRTSVMTHVAWVPERWADAAHGVMAELGERHPSRVILLFPRPDDPRDVIDAEVDYRCFVRGGQEREVCSEVITLWRARESPGEHRSTPARLGSAGLPSLARRSPVRVAGARPADRCGRPAGGRRPRVGGPRAG